MKHELKQQLRQEKLLNKRKINNHYKYIYFLRDVCKVKEHLIKFYKKEVDRLIKERLKADITYILIIGVLIFSLAASLIIN